MVEIRGDTQSSTNAALMILEQIELFKQGGPVLQTGRFMNKNMVEQFENSVFANQSKMMQITESSTKSRRRSVSRESYEYKIKRKRRHRSRSESSSSSSNRS